MNVIPKPTTVLLVEDDENIARALVSGLENKGWQVLSATNGERGLALARSEPADVILLDVMLPDLDGFTLCRVLHQELSAPILMLTARDHEMDRVTGLELGADDYIVKPFGLDELLARIEAILRRRRLDFGNALTPRLQVGEIVLDRRSRQAWRRGQAVELSPREFSLLAALMEHVGQAFSRQELLDRVWGESWTGSSRTLDVHIRWLREKVEDDATVPRYIETVRGHGYRIVDPNASHAPDPA